MEMKEKSEKQRERLRVIWCMIWFFATAVLMTIPYYQAMKRQEQIEICILKFLYCFLIMDILCSVIEDIPLMLQKLKNHKKCKLDECNRVTQKELQHRMQEQIIQEEERQKRKLEEGIEYQILDRAELTYERLERTLQKKVLGEEETYEFSSLLKAINWLLKIIQEDEEHYQRAEYMLRVCLPEIENITNIYLKILNIGLETEEDKARYCSFLKQCKIYLNDIKEQIYSGEKVDLEVSTSVMETIMKSRMTINEKGEK